MLSIDRPRLKLPEPSDVYVIREAAPDVKKPYTLKVFMMMVPPKAKPNEFQQKPCQVNDEFRYSSEEAAMNVVAELRSKPEFLRYGAAHRWIKVELWYEGKNLMSERAPLV